LASHRGPAAATHNPQDSPLLAYLSDQWRHSVEVARRHTLESESNAALTEGDAVARGPAAAGRLKTVTVHQEHVAIFEAIRARDPQAARRRAHEHLQQACERLGLDVTTTLISTTPGTRT